MTDVHTPEQRSRNMAAIKAKHTKPEMRVRSLLHSMGYRYRIHQKDLPGKPDIVLRKHKVVVFVHGCFWHRHNCRWGSVQPQTRPDFWNAKLSGNVERDERYRTALSALGWNVLTIWECETKQESSLRETLRQIGLS